MADYDFSQGGYSDSFDYFDEEDRNNMMGNGYQYNPNNLASFDFNYNDWLQNPSTSGSSTNTFNPENFSIPNTQPTDFFGVENNQVQSFALPEIPQYDVNPLQALDQVPQVQMPQELQYGNVSPFNNEGITATEQYRDPMEDVDIPVTYSQSDDSSSGGYFDSILGMLQRVGGGVSGLLGAATPLLPLLMMGSGIMSANARGDIADTIGNIADDVREEQDPYRERLRSMLIGGYGRPEAADYGLTDVQGISFETNPYIAKLQEAIQNSRYGLDEWMSGEGGQRAEAAARRMARAGRTGLIPMANLQAMRDYMSVGRKEKMSELQNLANLFSNEMINRMNNTVQSRNAQLTANTNRYNADVGNWRETANMLLGMSDPSDYINLYLAEAQADGTKYDPFMSGLANYLGMTNANAQPK